MGNNCIHTYMSLASLHVWLPSSGQRLAVSSQCIQGCPSLHLNRLGAGARSQRVVPGFALENPPDIRVVSVDMCVKGSHASGKTRSHTTACPRLSHIRMRQEGFLRGALLCITRCPPMSLLPRPLHNRVVEGDCHP